MKVVCMVPSWTEMLIECGIEVVGRTRFCIHPQPQVKGIPAVGGTKDLDWQKIQNLNADLLILDQEENLPWMKEQSPLPVAVTHVTSVSSVADEIEKLNLHLNNSNLRKIALRWRALENLQGVWNWSQIPGEIEKVNRNHTHYKQLVYVIWKSPWMRVANGTFISSVFEKLGAGSLWIGAESKYPTFELSQFDSDETYFLFSSEPFPFAKKKKDLAGLGLQASIVDGESFSWFGLRSLKFLEKRLNGAIAQP